MRYRVPPYFLLLDTVLVHLLFCYHNKNTYNKISSIESFVFVYDYLNPGSVDCSGNIYRHPQNFTIYMYTISDKQFLKK